MVGREVKPQDTTAVDMVFPKLAIKNHTPKAYFVRKNTKGFITIEQFFISTVKMTALYIYIYIYIRLMERILPKSKTNFWKAPPLPRSTVDSS
jgi:hypothetical protein